MWAFMHRRIQPLMARKRPMHKYSSVDDPDHHSSVSLALTEIEARVKVVSTLLSRSFMDDGSTLPLSKDVVCTLASSFMGRFYSFVFLGHLMSTL